ncbi:MAG: hypothetical protein IJ282_07430 [Lachnospiraceae bacterium]|nr:hypothetical protein [Lachnospiraceae bacterium]
MGFISYNLDYYYSELQKIESGAGTEEDVYRAKQLLKMLDDLVDEGYTELNEKLEESFGAVSRLQKYLESHNAIPFEILHKPVGEADVTYESDNMELVEAIESACILAKMSSAVSDDVFLTELVRFCEWIGCEEDTAYIFLLRDTLLPYIYYRGKGRSSAYPWLLGRKTMTMLAGKELVDDEIRASIIKALESGKCHDYDEFCEFVLPDIRECLERYPKMKECLMGLLGKITEKRIVVVESGCSGTFPMLLMSLDSRVDMRMYTTYPYLLETYCDKIFTSKYEENRLFETLYSQDLYFRFSDLRDGKFYVNKCASEEVEEKALAEIRFFVE